MTGSPIGGVWIATGLFCGQPCLVLAGWMPSSWATAGALLAILRLGIFSSWANTFQGGALAALAGCLIWGAAGRLRERPRTSTTAVLVTGLLSLTVTRPYETIWLGAASLAVFALSKQLTIGLLAPVTFTFSCSMALAFGAGWLHRRSPASAPEPSWACLDAADRSCPHPGSRRLRLGRVP